MKIEVILVAEDKPDEFSRAIMGWLKKPYSHVAFLIDDKTIYHCATDGVTCEPAEESLKGCKIFSRVTVPSLRPDCCVISWFEGSLGGSYGLLQCLGMVFPWLRWLVGNGGKQRVCSEYVIDGLAGALGHKIDKSGRDWIAPPEAFLLAMLIAKAHA